MQLPVLRSGNKSETVKAMQALLTGYGYSVGASGLDGSFGPATCAALKQYQTQSGLDADGVCGPKTWEKLLGMGVIKVETILSAGITVDGNLIITIFAAMGIPTAITAFCSWWLQRKITKRDKARDEAEAKKERKAEERERDREKLDVMLLQSTTAAIALGEATAKAVQRIPDAHCNGDMHTALEYAAKVQDQQKDFLTSLGIHALHED